MELVDVGVEALGDRWDERDLEGSGGDHHLPGLEHVLPGLGDIHAVALGSEVTLVVCRTGSLNSAA